MFGDVACRRRPVKYFGLESRAAGQISRQECQGVTVGIGGGNVKCKIVSGLYGLIAYVVQHGRLVIGGVNEYP